MPKRTKLHYITETFINMYHIVLYKKITFRKINKKCDKKCTPRRTKLHYLKKSSEGAMLPNTLNKTHMVSPCAACR